MHAPFRDDSTDSETSSSDDERAEESHKYASDVLEHFQERRSYPAMKSWNLLFGGMVELMQ
eukprot:2546001-Karenia_brevis.AAC.1